MTNPRVTEANLLIRLHASETTRIKLAGDLELTQRALWRERALRRHPRIEQVVELIPHVSDEESFLEYASKLARFAP